MYGEAAGQAASFVEDDAFTATMSMNDAERKFVAAQQDVSTLTAAAIELESALDERMAALGRSRLVTIGVSASLAVLLSVAASIFFGRLISRSVGRMTSAMRQLAAGDLAVDIPATDRKDEVGAMAQAMVVFKSNAEETRRLQAAADEDHALKARRQAAMDRYTQDLRHLRRRRDGEPRPLRRGDAEHGRGNVGSGAPHTRQCGTRRGRRHYVGDQSRRRRRCGGGDVVQHQ